MAAGMLRRGLPRVKGGEAWPPAMAVGGAETADAESVVAEPLPVAAAEPEPAAEQVAAAVAAPAPAEQAAPAAPTATESAAAEVARGLRRGLPRVAGGDPWPPAGAAAAVAAPAMAAAAATAPVSAAPISAAPAATETPAAAPSAPAASAAVGSSGEALRRGLPRVAGGEAWPPAGVTASVVVVEAQPEAVAAVEVESAVAAPALAASDVSTPLPFHRTAWLGITPRHDRSSEVDAEPARRRPTWPQAIGGLMGAAALGLLAVAVVFFVRALLSMPFMQDFLAMFPGEYHPAIAVEPGFAPWVGWQHFFNMFLMVLIIRSGLGVRTEKRPTAFWTPRGDSKGKISLTLWFHQSLDLLWIINGVIFIALLFVTGHWVRIVPTSWEVIPNALSAGLQYISLDWPTDNGWVNYNSLQQLAYFFTVFIAAPVAVITGFRMSGLWPKNAEKLSKAYPIEWARAVHFPTMLYFVAFILVHVALVVLTGFLRNLNHMFASLGSVDGVQYAANWTGFWVFVVAVVAIVGAWFAARPLVLAPIAKLFGQVSGR